MKKIVLAGLFLLSFFAISAQAVTHHRWPIDYFASPEASRWFDHTPLCGYLCRYDGAGNQGGTDHHGTDILGNISPTYIRAGAVGSLYYRFDSCSNNGSPGDTCGGGYGNHVRIQHPDGKVTIYAHMLQGVTGLQTALCGASVGEMGNSGDSSGNHLHLEMWSDIYATVRIDHFGGAYSGLVYWVSQNANGYGLPSMVCE